MAEPLVHRKSGECYEDDDCAMFACPLCYEDRLHRLKFGPRTYTPEQVAFMDRVVRERQPLPEEPLPIEQDPCPVCKGVGRVQRLVAATKKKCEEWVPCPRCGGAGEVVR